MKLLKTTQLIEKKSKFYGYLFECNSEEEVMFALNDLRKKHNKATHVCWAGRIKMPFYERANDDGEPSGTAGRPILSVLQKRNLNNVCAVVVRYFGGIKLGAGGLLRVYSKVAGMLCEDEILK